jgi:hypothetical protein
LAATVGLTLEDGTTLEVETHPLISERQAQQLVDEGRQLGEKVWYFRDLN